MRPAVASQPGPSQLHRCQVDGVEVFATEESDIEPVDSEGATRAEDCRKPRSSSTSAFGFKPIRRTQQRSSASPVSPQAMPLLSVDVSAAPSAPSTTGKRKPGRNSSPCDSPKPASNTSVPEETGKERGQIKRSYTTPSLRQSNVDQRSKSRGNDGKAKEPRADRPAALSGQEMPVDAKNSPQQVFRALTGRFSAPPTPRRHTPRAPKRTPRLSPRATFPQSQGLQSVKAKDTEDTRRQAWDHIRENNREERLRRQRMSEIQERGPVQKTPPSAVEPARSSTSGSTSLLMRPLSSIAQKSTQVAAVIPLEEEEGDYQEFSSVADSVEPDSAPPLPMPAGSSTMEHEEMIVANNLEADHVASYCNGNIMSGAETPSDSSDWPVPRVREGKSSNAQSVVDNSRIMRLIGRRSVLSQPPPVLGPPDFAENARRRGQQQQQQPQQQHQQLQPQQLQPQPQPHTQLQPQSQRQRSDRGGATSFRNSVPGSPSSPPKPDTVRSNRLSGVSSASAGNSAAHAAPARGETRAEASASTPSEISRSSGKSELDAKRRPSSDNLMGSRASATVAVSQASADAKVAEAKSTVDRLEIPQEADVHVITGASSVDSAVVRQAYLNSNEHSPETLIPTQLDFRIESLENVREPPHDDQELLRDDQGVAPTSGSAAVEIPATASVSTISVMPEDEDEAGSPSASTTTTMAGSQGVSTAVDSAALDSAPADMASHSEQPVDSALQGETMWFKEAAAQGQSSALAGESGAVIWQPPRPGAKQEAGPPETQPQVQLQTQFAVPATAATTAGGAWPVGFSDQMALAETQASYGLAVNGHVPFAVQPMMQNEVGSLVVPTTWRYLQPPPQMLPTPVDDAAGAVAPSSPSSQRASPEEPAGSGSASSPTEDLGAVIIKPVGSDKDTDVLQSADEAPIFEPMDVDAKRQLLSDLVQCLADRMQKTEQALGSEQRANHAMRVTLEVLQRQNLHLQQQLAWVTQSWPYANMPQAMAMP